MEFRVCQEGVVTIAKMKFAWKYRRPLWKYRKLIARRREIAGAAIASAAILGFVLIKLSTAKRELAAE